MLLIKWQTDATNLSRQYTRSISRLQKYTQAPMINVRWDISIMHTNITCQH